MKKKILHTLFLLIAIVCFLCKVSNAQNYQWKSLPMGAGGFVSGIITSKQQQNLIYCRTDVGGAYKWNAATSTWTPLLDWASATQSGFYGVESLAIDPQAANKLYLMVGISYFDNGKSAILSSNDYGQTFTVTDVTSQFKVNGNGMGRSNGERLQVDPNLGSVLYAGTRSNGLWKSTNSGATWARLNSLNITTTPNGNGISFVLIDPASATAGNPSQTIYVGVSQHDSAGTNFYKSMDGGNTFNPVSGRPLINMPQRVALTSAGDLIINYANGSGPYGTTFGTSNENMNNGAIYRFTPSTNTWTNITPSGIARAWGGISVDPNNPNRMVASTINNYQFQYNPGAYGDKIYFTTNGGTSWTDVFARGFSMDANGIPWMGKGDAIHWAGSIEFDPFNTQKVFVTSGNGIFSNDNIDASSVWKFDVKGLEETVPTDIVSVPGGPLFTTIGDYDGFKFTDISQYGQRYVPKMGTTTGIAYAGNNPNYLVRVGSSMYYSTDQGTTWVQTGAINGSQGKVSVSSDGTRIYHCPNGSSTTYYSTDNGSTWTASTINVSNAIPVADKVNPNKVYIYNSGSGNFNVSTNGGASFSVTVGIGGGGSKTIRTAPGVEGDIWVAMYGGGLKRSVNSGTSFTTITSVTACSAVGLGKAAPGASYFTVYIWGTVSGVTGIFRSTDEGATWVRINTDATMFGGPGNAQFVMGDMNTFGTAYMSTVGRGVIAGQNLSALPVSLASLNVQELQQNGRHTALLNWKTFSESNLSYFTVERGTNGSNWKSLENISSKAFNGNSSNLLSYNYNDNLEGLTGTVNYRLKMVDKDDHFTYGNIVSLNIGKAISAFAVNISPNPVIAKSGVNVHFTSDKNQKIIVRIVSANGAVLSSKSLSLQSGVTNLNMAELTNQPAGVYTLKVISSTNNQSMGAVKFIIQ